MAQFLMIIFIKIKASRKSNEKDIIKYHLSIKKEILKTNVKRFCF